MMTRRSRMIAAPLLVVPGLAWSAEEPAKKAEVQTEAAAKTAGFLLVQNTQSIHYADGRPTLRGVSPTTIHAIPDPEPWRATMLANKIWRVAVLFAVLSPLTVGRAVGQDKAPASASPPAQTATSPARVIEQGALDLVKKMSAKLAATPAFLVRTRSSTEAPGGTGQFLTFFTESVVAVERPNKLSAEIRGDAPPFDFYFDGVKMTAYEPTRKLYATTDAPKTLDELLPFATKTAGLLLPFEDVLYSDPYTELTRDMTSAFYAGYSVIRGTRCEHVALAAPGIEGQIWIDAKTDLPCLIAGTLPNVQGAPRFTVEFYDWKLQPKLPGNLFTFTKPEGAEPMDFRALTGAER